MNILCWTGSVRTVLAITVGTGILLQKEWEDGIDESGIKPGIIKIAVRRDTILSEKLESFD
jgi:predicted metal-dependent phosphotriesterase family hydrolase